MHNFLGGTCVQLGNTTGAQGSVVPTPVVSVFTRTWCYSHEHVRFQVVGNSAWQCRIKSLRRCCQPIEHQEWLHCHTTQASCRKEHLVSQPHAWVRLKSNDEGLEFLVYNAAGILLSTERNGMFLPSKTMKMKRCSNPRISVFSVTATQMLDVVCCKLRSG